MTLAQMALKLRGQKAEEKKLHKLHKGAVAAGVSYDASLELYNKWLLASNQNFEATKELEQAVEEQFRGFGELHTAKMVDMVMGELL